MNYQRFRCRRVRKRETAYKTIGISIIPASTPNMNLGLWLLRDSCLVGAWQLMRQTAQFG